MIEQVVKDYSEQLTKLGIENTVVEHPEFKKATD